MPWWGWLVIAVVAMAAFDLVMLALERRGLVYWRRRKPPRGAASTAMLELQGIFEPAAEQVVVERTRAASEIEEAGDDDPLRG